MLHAVVVKTLKKKHFLDRYRYHTIYKNKDSSSERLVFKSSKTNRGSFLDLSIHLCVNILILVTQSLLSSTRMLGSRPFWCGSDAALAETWSHRPFASFIRPSLSLSSIPRWMLCRFPFPLIPPFYSEIFITTILSWVIIDSITLLHLNFFICRILKYSTI